MTAKYDVKRELKACYAPKNTDWEVLDIPELRFLAIDGHGDPNTSPAYRRAVEALYPVAYTVKFASKANLGKDFVVGPLEGLWWADDMDDFLARRKDNWRWRLLINIPDWITDDMIEDARRTALAKKNLPAIADVRSETLREGTSAQVLHIGSYDDETPILARLHQEYLPAHKLRERGLHHEIYLSDPRKTSPARLRTILRQPVKACSG
ncbi:GyrI-like domain-containing protein [Streptomyces sp. NPDC002853]